MASVPGVLDFLVPYILFNVQSATLSHPFWTSAYLNSASTSNLPRLLVPFGLQHTFPPRQHPIRRSCSSLLDFLVPLLRFNVQSTALAHPFWTSSCRISASTSNLPRFLISFGLQHTFPPLQRPIHRACPISHTPLWSIGKRERRSSRFLTPFFLWTRGESNPCPKTHSLFFYYHS